MSYPPQASVKAETGLATLLSRLTPTRATYIDKTYDALHHPTYIFPGDTSLECTFTAGLAADTWGEWAEIVDSGETTLSSLFASKDGHITVIQEEEVSDEATRYMVEIAYGEGEAKVHVTAQRFAGSGKFQNPDNHARLFVQRIPAGEPIYYRMKSNTAVADTAKVHIRYHLH
ncbi:hypothetical protein ES703_63730 [subsurface metagenome]